MSYFPMFIELKGKRCLVVGGGRIALRKIEVLKEFGADLLVVSPVISQEILQITEISCREKQFESEDLKGQEVVVAATDDKELNHRISRACRERQIPVNAVDQTEDCTFLFPAYLKEGEVVAAFSSGGQSPVVTQYLKAQSAPFLTHLVGETAACLGSLRKTLQQCIKSEKERKEIYGALLQMALKEGEVPSGEAIARVIAMYTQRAPQYDTLFQSGLIMYENRAAD